MLTRKEFSSNFIAHLHFMPGRGQSWKFRVKSSIWQQWQKDRRKLWMLSVLARNGAAWKFALSPSTHIFSSWISRPLSRLLYLFPHLSHFYPSYAIIRSHRHWSIFKYLPTMKRKSHHGGLGGLEGKRERDLRADNGTQRWTQLFHRNLNSQRF